MEMDSSYPEDSKLFYDIDSALEFFREMLDERLPEIERPKHYDEDFISKLNVRLYEVNLEKLYPLPYKEWCEEMYNEWEEEAKQDEEDYQKHEYETLIRLCRKFKDQVPTILRVIESEKQ